MDFQTRFKGRIAMITKRDGIDAIISSSSSPIRKVKKSQSMYSKITALNEYQNAQLIKTVSDICHRNSPIKIRDEQVNPQVRSSYPTNRKLVQSHLPPLNHISQIAVQQDRKELLAIPQHILKYVIPLEYFDKIKQLAANNNVDRQNAYLKYKANKYSY